MGVQGVLAGAQGALGVSQAFQEREALKAQQAQSNAASEFNQQVAEFKAEDAIERGAREADLVKRRGKQIIGSQRAAFAAQGIDVESGSALDVQLDTAAISEIDALTIKNNAAKEAFGFKIQALQDTGQRRFSDLAFEGKKRGTILTAGLGLFGGVFQAAGAIGNRPRTTQPRQQGVPQAQTGSGQSFGRFA